MGLDMRGAGRDVDRVAAEAGRRWLAYFVILSLAVSTALDAADLHEINPPATPPEQAAIALMGGRIIDGHGGRPIENGVIVVRGSQIAAVGPVATTPVPDDARRVTIKGATVLPGLIDSHLHTINDLDVPARFLRHGITTFRDPGHPFRFYQAVLQTERPMPRVFLCGAHLDAYPPVWPQEAIIVNNAQHARDTVSAHVARGATAIKIYFRLPLDYYSAVCETAAQHNIPVTAHLELVDADDAIRAGVIGIEHATSFGTALATPTVAAKFKELIEADSAARRIERYRLWATLDLVKSKRLDPLLDLIVSRGVFVSPTLAVFERRPGDRGATEIHARGFQNMIEFIRLCHARGATIVPGSHTSVPHAEPGWAYQRELELLVEAGLSPLEAITAGTVHNARFLGAGDRLGSLEPGKLADLVLVRGNPAEDIRVLYHVEHVMLNGTWVTEPPVRN